MQEIIVYIILSAVAVIAAYMIFKSFRKPQKSCNDCSDESCAGCPIEELKEEIRKKNPELLIKKQKPQEKKEE